MKNYNSIISMLVLVLMLIAFFAFLMPFVSVDFWGSSYALTGMDFMTNPEYECEKLFLISFCATIISAVGGIICYFGNRSLVLPMVSSIIGAGSALLFYPENTDYVTTGFWVFTLSHAITTILSFCSLLSSVKNEEEQTDTYPQDSSSLDGLKIIDQATMDSRKEEMRNTSWKCSCGQINAGYITTCGCGKTKSEAVIQGTTWKCSCGRTNAGYTVICSCGKSQSEVETGNTSWKCSCGQVNSGYSNVCDCGKTKSEATRGK